MEYTRGGQRESIQCFDGYEINANSCNNCLNSNKLYVEHGEDERRTHGGPIVENEVNRGRKNWERQAGEEEEDERCDGSRGG